MSWGGAKRDVHAQFSLLLELRLPREKLRRLKLLVAEWRHRKSCLRKELESLVGNLSHVRLSNQEGDFCGA